MKIARSPMPDAETLLRLSIQVLIAERKIERELMKAKGEEKKKLEEMMARIKKVRDRIIRLYTALMLRGKPSRIPTLAEVRRWP